MPIIVNLDLNNTVTLIEDKEGVYSLAVEGKISGLTSLRIRQIDQARNAAGVPALDAVHPIFTSLTCTGREFRGESKGLVGVVLTYTRLGLPGSTSPLTGQTISVGGSLREYTTTKDVDGAPIICKWPGRPDQGGTVTIDQPLHTIHISRRETVNPGPLSRQYLGTTNTAAGFDLAQSGVEEDTWRCTEYSGVTEDNGDSWNVDYEFGYAEGKWDQYAEYTDPDTGKRPDGFENLTAEQQAAARVKVKSHKRKNFNSLNLI